jgi:hypothetical protein
MLLLYSGQKTKKRIKTDVNRKQSSPEDGTDMLLRNVKWVSKDYCVASRKILLFG